MTEVNYMAAPPSQVLDSQISEKPILEADRGYYLFNSLSSLFSEYEAEYFIKRTLCTKLNRH